MLPLKTEWTLQARNNTPESRRRMTELHDTAAPLRHPIEPDPDFWRDAAKKFMSASAIETLVRRAIEAIWNRGDLSLADELFAPGFVNHHGLITDLVSGPEAIKVSAAFYRLAFPDLHVTVDALTIQEDTVVLYWTARRSSPDNSDDGAFNASQTLLTAGITRSRWADGKIMESWTEWNGDQACHHLGVVG